jgi:hypothetical protein
MLKVDAIKRPSARMDCIFAGFGVTEDGLEEEGWFVDCWNC